MHKDIQAFYQPLSCVSINYFTELKKEKEVLLLESSFNLFYLNMLIKTMVNWDNFWMIIPVPGENIKLNCFLNKFPKVIR